MSSDREPDAGAPLRRLTGPVVAFVSQLANGATDPDVPGSAEPQQLEPATVVIVDDEPDIRFILRRMLEDSGRFRIVGECGDGEAAIEAADEHAPDVVLLDLLMPGMDGFEAAPQIIRVSPRTMLVALSALKAEQQAGRVLAAGAFAYIEKSQLGPRLVDGLGALLSDFRRALAGDTVVAPGR